MCCKQLEFINVNESDNKLSKFDKFLFQEFKNMYVIDKNVQRQFFDWKIRKEMLAFIVKLTLVQCDVLYCGNQIRFFQSVRLKNEKE